MARILVTGSAAGLGRAAAQALLDDGHEVVVHARSNDRLAGVADLVDRGAAAVIGDLADPDETRGVAEQVNRLGRMDAVIHNAGVYSGPLVMPVNVVAPYLLTALVQRPARLVYLSSDMHRGGRADVARLVGGRGTYPDSKLFVTTLAFAIARMWPSAASNTVDPGWVPTRMGGSAATDDLRLGHVTQAWLAAGDDTEARGTGGYWYHRQLDLPHPAVRDRRFQDELLAALAQATGAPLAPPDPASGPLVGA